MKVLIDTNIWLSYLIAPSLPRAITMVVDAKHEIAFEDAITIFEDLKSYIVDVTKPEYGEARYLIVGKMDDGRLIAVVYTHRDGKRRIISARKARKNEQRDYSKG